MEINTTDVIVAFVQLFGAPLLTLIGSFAAYKAAGWHAKAQVAAETEERRIEKEELENERERKFLEMADQIRRNDEAKSRDIEGLRNKLEAKEKAHAEALAFRDQVIQDRERELKQQLELSAHDRTTHQKQIEELMETNTTVKAVAEELKSQLAQVNAEKEILQINLSEKTVEATGQKVLIEAVRGDLVKVIAERDTLKNQYDQQAVELATAIQSNADKDEIINRLKAGLESKEHELSVANGKILELQQQLDFYKFQQALEEPVNEPAPTHPPVIESASAEPTAIDSAGDTGGAAA